MRRARYTFDVAGEWVHEVSIPRRGLNPSISFCPVWLRLRLLFSVMALSLEGPQQRGQSVNGQYVYWICMVYPSAETVQNHGVKTPDDFDRESSRVAGLEAHSFADVQILETICFREPHSSGELHLNLLVRAARPYLHTSWHSGSAAAHVYGQNAVKCYK